ncbi:MAG: CsbD family protein [Bryobacteraceae bacterium]
MNNSTTDKIEGNLHEAKGKVKETVGQVINDSDLEAEGKAENLAGKVQKKVGQIKEVFDK